MSTLVDRCKQAKATMHLSNQKLSEKSGVPLSTVNNFFRSEKRSPSIDTAGPICAVLGVSMDDFFGIQKDNPENHKADLSRQLSKLEAEHKVDLVQNELLREIVDKQHHGIRSRNHIITNLIVALLLAIIWIVHLDLSCLDVGFWRG